MNQFPPAAECAIGTISNFYESSLRYSKVKLSHLGHNTGDGKKKFEVESFLIFCWDAEKKVWGRKFFHILLRCCWVAVNAHIRIFYFSLRWRQADFGKFHRRCQWVTPAINYRRCCRYRRKIITVVIVTGDRLIDGCYEIENPCLTRWIWLLKICIVSSGPK